MKNKHVDTCVTKTVLPIILATYFSLQPLFAHSPMGINGISPPYGLIQQNYSIQGTVSDINGPIPGVNILIKGTTQGTLSDMDGKFRLKVSPTDTLVFSYIGYKTLTLAVNGQKQLNVQLQSETTQLQEVEVNAGYYTVKERERTGSIGKITSEEIERQPVGNVLQTMQGRIAGVSVQQSTGIPGGGFSIKIRGRNSLVAGNQPLYIIDGIPLQSDSMEPTFSTPVTQGGNPLQILNVSDIQGIEVLKDADATAIYGSRGANGVVLITTKQGQAGKARLEIHMETGIGKVTRMLSMLNTPEYLEMRKEAYANDGVVPTIANAPDLLLWDQHRYTDWQQELLGGTAFIVNGQAAVSGGNERTQFRLGGTWRNESGVFPGNFGDKKLSFNLSFNHRDLNDKLSVRGSVLYGIDQNSQPITDPTLIAVYTPPNAPEVFTDDGNLNWEENTFSNPFALMWQHYTNKSNSFIGSAVLAYSITPKLTAKANFGYNRIDSDQQSLTPLKSLNPSYYNTGEASFGQQVYNSWILEPQLTYNTPLWKGRLQLLLGTTFQQNYRQIQEFYAGGFTNDALLENIAAGESLRISNFLESEYHYQATFGRINYNYNGRYLINVTARRDGSSRFGPQKQWANFGAIGVAWMFYKEPWLKQNEYLSFGKLRGSYGTTGNDQIADYGYLDSWFPNYYTYGNTTGLYPARLYNPTYSWEINKKLEMSMELGFFQDRIHLATSYYSNRSSNQLVGQPLPATTGFFSIQNNLNAIVQNTGWEIELHTKNISRNNWAWDTDLLLTIPETKLVAFPNLEASVYANSYVVGKPLDIVKTYHYLGVNSDTGYYEFEDVNGDGRVSAPMDKQTLKRLGPQYYGSINNSLQWGSWQLTMLWDGMKQTGWNYNYTNGAAPGFLRNQPALVTGRWQHSGDDTAIQRYIRGGEGSSSYNLLKNSSYSIIDASYLRLRNFSLSYTLSPKWTKKLHLHSYKLFLQGQNLITISNYPGMDPENKTTNALPPLKIISGGIQLSL